MSRSSPAFHGYAPPDRRTDDTFTPPLTVAVSRETGARGRAVAERTAEMLGWPFIHQETLEHVTQVPSLQEPMLHTESLQAANWVEQRVAELIEEGPLGTNSELIPLARTILRIASQDNCVILGRGAGIVLRSDAKLYVRIVAPEKERIAYVAQVERLSLDEAEALVRRQDETRRAFITTKFGRSPEDVTQFDLVLNAAKLGVDACASIIFTAAREKEAYLLQRRRQA